MILSLATILLQAPGNRPVSPWVVVAAEVWDRKPILATEKPGLQSGLLDPHHPSVSVLPAPIQCKTAQKALQKQAVKYLSATLPVPLERVRILYAGTPKKGVRTLTPPKIINISRDCKRNLKKMIRIRRKWTKNIAEWPKRPDPEFNQNIAHKSHKCKDFLSSWEDPPRIPLHTSLLSLLSK